LKHLIPTFIVLPLALNDKQYAVDDLSLEGTVGVIHFAIENLKGPLSRVVKLGRCLIGMRKEVDKNFFDLIIFGQRKPLNEVLDPYFGVIFNVLPDQLIQVLTDDKALVPNTVDYAGHQHHIVLLLLAVLGVENDLHYLLGYAEQLDALVD
jgi:hypothetical protein